jgi:hypothetical protein
VLDGVLEGQDTPLALGLVSHVGVLLPHAHHDTLGKKPQYPVLEDGRPGTTGCSSAPGSVNFNISVLFSLS